MKNWYCLILLTLFSLSLQAQKDSTSTQKKEEKPYSDKKIYLQERIDKDTTQPVIDSSIYNNKKEAHFYDSIQKKLDNSKAGKLINEYLIRDHNVEASINSDFVESEEYFKRFEGKVINEISFVKVDVVEGSVMDSSIHTSTKFGELLDKTHSYTKDRVLEKNLLLESGDTVEAFRLSDNERIIRSLPYIYDAKIFVVKSKTDTNEVDVSIFVEDRYSISGTFQPLYFDRYNAEVYEMNALGSGNELRFQMSFDASKPQTFGYSPQIRFDNLFGTFINGRFEYKNYYQLEEYSAFFNKDFVAPEVKNVGGYTFDDLKAVYKPALFNVPDSLEPSHKFHSVFNDLWYGRTFLVDNSQKRTNLVLTLRYENKTFFERPYTSIDSNRFFHNHNTVVSGISLIRSTYFKTKKLFQFGVSEDIPRGYLASLVTGLDFHEYETRPYLGISLWGSHYFKNVGYFAIRGASGSFYSKNTYTDWTTTFSLDYFTRLLHIGKYDFRQFIRFYYSNLKHQKYQQDRVIFNNYIRGVQDVFDNPKQMLVLNIEPVFFTPWNWIGFRFAFYTFLDMAYINSQGVNNRYEKAYSATGLGFRIRNDNLAFNIIQIRLAYYFNLPTGVIPYGAEFSTSSPNYYRQSNLLRPDIVHFGQ